MFAVVQPTTMMASPLAVAEATPRTLSRPALLTLSGLYGTTKGVYSSYVPTAAASMLESLATKLLTVGTPIVEPYVAKMLAAATPEAPAAARAAAPAAKKGAFPSDLQGVDSMLIECLAAGDAKIDAAVTATMEHLSGAKARVVGAKDGVTEAVAYKVEQAKAFVWRKYAEAVPAVVGQVNAAKESAQHNAQVQKIVATATPFIESAKTNAGPASDMISGLASKAKAEVDTKGLVACSKDFTNAIERAAKACVSTIQTKGAVEGVKDISGNVLSTVTTALEEAKKPLPTALQSADEPFPVQQPVSPALKPQRLAVDDN